MADNEKNYSEMLAEYKATLSSLNAQCSAAEKSCIVAETNLTNFKSQLDQLVQEAETAAGCSLKDIPALLSQEKQKLSGIMSELSGISLDGQITQDVLDSITAVAEKYGIAVA